MSIEKSELRYYLGFSQQHLQQEVAVTKALLNSKHLNRADQSALFRRVILLELALKLQEVAEQELAILNNCLDKKVAKKQRELE